MYKLLFELSFRKLLVHCEGGPLKSRAFFRLPEVPSKFRQRSLKVKIQEFGYLHTCWSKDEMIAGVQI